MVFLWLSACAKNEKPIAAKKSPPTINVLLITMDTTRADHLGCYGYQSAKTPTIDRLASEGILFENAYCQIPITLPSHASILTGLYPPHHGIRLNGPYALPAEIPTLASILKSQGYATGAFVSAPVLSSQFGLNRDFDRYDDEVLNDPLGHADRRAGATLERAQAWLKTNRQSPFFLWIHFFDPHFPYAPPEPFASQFREKPYDGEIAYVDSVVADLLSHLEREGRIESTLIVLTADHGEGLSEHGEFTHGLFAYDTTLHVPLIFRIPKGSKEAEREWKSGTRSSSPAQSADVLPTVLEIVGVDAPESLDGRSLLRAAELTKRRLYAETLYPLSFGWCPLRSAREGNLKYIHGAKPQLFDLSSDPGELTNLFAQREDSTLDLRNWIENVSIKEARASARSSATSQNLSAIQGLGYLGSSASKVPSQSWVSLPDPVDRLKIFDAVNAARSEDNEGRSAEAVAELEPYLREEKDNPVLLQVLGDAYIHHGDYAKGVETLTHYQEIAPGDPEAAMCLGNGLFKSGSLDGARRAFDLCVELLPTYAEAWDHLGVVFEHLRQLDKGADAGMRAIALEPFNPDFHENYGVTLLRMNRGADAEAEFRKAIELGGKTMERRMNLGLALNSEGKFKEAREVFTQILSINPKHIQAVERLIVADYQLGEMEELQKWADQLRQSKTESPLARFYEGRVRLDQGNLDEALKDFEAAIQGLPDFPTAYVALGETLMRIGNTTEKADWLLDQAAKWKIKLPDELESRLKKLALGQPDRTPSVQRK